MQLTLFALIADALCVYDPAHTAPGGYAAPEGSR